jgi:hypothetical protein
MASRTEVEEPSGIRMRSGFMGSVIWNDQHFAGRRAYKSDDCRQTLNLIATSTKLLHFANRACSNHSFAAVKHYMASIAQNGAR